MRTFWNMTLSTVLVLLLSSSACYAQTSEDTMLEEARGHFKSGKYYFAATWLGRILENNPASSHRKEVLLLISKAYALSGREEKAIPYLHGLLSEFPETATTLEPQLLKLAQSVEPTRPAAIVPRSSPQSPPPSAKKPSVPAAVRKVPTVAATPAVPIVAPAPRPVEPVPVPVPVAAPVPAGIAEKSAGGSAVDKPVKPAKKTSPPPQKPEQSPMSGNQVPAAATAIEPHAGRGEQRYYVLAGETTNRLKIEALLKKLKESRLGLQPVIREETKSKEVYRLVADCSDDRDSAENRLLLISRTIRNTFMIRDGNSYCTVVGSLSSEQAAMQEQRRVAGKGLQVRIVKYQVPLVVWQVVVGRFVHASDAETVVKAIAAEGISATVVKLEV